MNWYRRWKTNRLKEKLLELENKAELIRLEFDIKSVDNNLNKLILEVRLKKILEEKPPCKY